jgi:hypothetical protein
MATHNHEPMKAERRPLPKYKNIGEKRDEGWLFWKLCPPVLPGWYWVWAEGAWPQCVEYKYERGCIRAVDRHDQLSHPRAFWQMCAGPIPDPETPTSVNRDRRKK